MAKENEAEYRRQAGRSLRWLLVSLLLLQCGYVFYVQVICSDELSQRSERQLNRVVYIPARRGAIVDRHGAKLTNCEPQYDLSLLLERLRDPRDTQKATLQKAQAAIAELSVFLGGDYYQYRPSREALEAHVRRYAPLPFVLWTNIDQATMLRFQRERHRFPFAELTMTWQRLYYHDQVAAHVCGYARREQRVRPEVRELLAEQGISAPMNVQDWQGVSGVEQSMDDALAGRAGFQRVQTDVFSFRHETVEMAPVEAGKTVALTLDLQLQALAERLLLSTGHAGALVAMDARTGELLVLASVPSHHLPPTSGDHAVSGAYLNRAIAGYYTPGSTLKPLVALVALERGLLTPAETIYCPGFYELPDGRRIACASRYGHGEINVTQALAQSCNTFFCEIGMRLGELGWRQLALAPTYRELLGCRTGMTDLAGEKAGIFFAPPWVEASRRSDPVWRDGDSAHAGIGQGGWIVTPLQLAVYACAITTGKLFRPYVVAEVGRRQRAALSWPPQVWEPVRQGLLDCVRSPRGTGRRLRLENGIGVYAKTGTAEHVSGRSPHAWMFAVAPAEVPRYVLACVVEEGGHGGVVVAPILKQMLQEMLKP